MIATLRRYATTDEIGRYWMRAGDAAPLVLVRTFWGFVTFFWTLTLVPDVDVIFFHDGLRPDRDLDDSKVFSLFRWLGDGSSAVDAVYVATVAVLLGSSLCVMAGWRIRISVPVAAFLQISLIDQSQSWGIGAERTMVLGALYMGVFATLTPSHLQGHHRNREGSFGIAPLWGIQLMQLQLAIAYLSTSISKLGGGDWLDGSAVYHAIESDQLQRFEPWPWLTDNPWTIHMLTYGTLAVELALAPLLLWPRTRRLGVVLAIALHVGFEIFLELGFFAMSMMVLILAYVPARDARRVLNPIGRLTGRASQRSQSRATVTP